MRQFVLGIVALVGLWSGPVDAAVLHLSDDSTRDAAACEQTDTAVLVQIGETWEVFPHAGVTRIDGACERVSPEPAAEPAPPATPSPVPAPPVAAVATFPVAYAGTDAFWGWRVSNGAGGADPSIHLLQPHASGAGGSRSRWGHDRGAAA